MAAKTCKAEVVANMTTTNMTEIALGITSKIALFK